MPPLLLLLLVLSSTTQSAGDLLAPPPPGVRYVPMFERLNSSVCYKDPTNREDISFPCRRKPGLVTLGSTTIAFAGWSLRRSEDGGHSWGSPIEVSHEGCAMPKNGVMVPDEQTQTLFFLVSCRYPGNGGLWILNSTDGGRSWGSVSNISSMADPPAGSKGGRPPTAGPVPAIGGGIQARSGRLLAQFYSEYCWDDPSGGCKLPPPGPFAPPPRGRPESTNGWCEANFLMMSDDHGASWRSSPVFGATGAEGEVAQLADGRLYYNYRSDGPMIDHCPDGAQQCDTGWGGNISRACGRPSVPGRLAPQHCRYAMFSSDEGDSWHDAAGVPSAYGTSIPDLPDPGCKGSVTWWPSGGSGGGSGGSGSSSSPAGNGLLASNIQNNGDPPIEAPHRFNLTLSFSRDGIAWPERVSLYRGGAAYSSVKMLRMDPPVAAVHFEAPWVVGAPTVLAIVDLLHVFDRLKSDDDDTGGGDPANCTLNNTVRGGTMYTHASPYSTTGWDKKTWQACAQFCQSDPIGGHPCLAWEVVPNYVVINFTHPLACLFYATVPDCIESEAPAGVTGCGLKGLAAEPGKCCAGGQCQVAGFECTGKVGLYQCAKVAAANGTNGTITYPDEQSCLQHCTAPPPPPPGPPPPPPVYTKPYLRFAQVIPISNLRVDCAITQGSTTHVWNNYAFGEFSDWIAIFKAAPATLTVAVAGKVLLTKTVPLTTGPLVVALRPDNVPVGHNWPPTDTSIELIAASYVPSPAGTASVRLFSLSPSTASASLAVGGKAVVDGIKYSLGSKWVQVPTAGQETFTVLDSITRTPLATVTGSPPLSPSAATVFLYGVAQTGTAAKLLSDAPERMAELQPPPPRPSLPPRKTDDNGDGDESAAAASQGWRTTFLPPVLVGQKKQLGGVSSAKGAFSESMADYHALDHSTFVGPALAPHIDRASGASGMPRAWPAMPLSVSYDGARSWTVVNSSVAMPDGDLQAILVDHSTKPSTGHNFGFHQGFAVDVSRSGDTGTDTGTDDSLATFVAHNTTTFEVVDGMMHTVLHADGPATFSGVPVPPFSTGCQAQLDVFDTVRLPGRQGFLLSAQVCAVMAKPSTRRTIAVFHSDDSYKWSFRALVFDPDRWFRQFNCTGRDMAVCMPNEHSMVRLQSGTLLVVARVAGDGTACQYDATGRSIDYTNYFQVTSTDTGQNWGRPAEMHGLGCVRPQLLVLPGGPLLLSGGRQCTAGTKDAMLWVNYKGTAEPGEWEAHSLSGLHNRLWKHHHQQQQQQQQQQQRSPDRDDDWHFTPLINESRSAGATSWETQAYTSLLPAGEMEAVVMYNLYVGGAAYHSITNTVGFAMRVQLARPVLKSDDLPGRRLAETEVEPGAQQQQQPQPQQQPEPEPRLQPQNDDDTLPPPRWKQDVFAISEWQSPYIVQGSDWEVEAAKRYAEFSDANFTVLLGSLHVNATNASQACRCSKGTEACCGHTASAFQMRLCEQHGLKCVPGIQSKGGRTNKNHWGGDAPVDRLDPAATNSSAFWGFDVWDEPGTSEFTAVSNISSKISALYPGRLRFVNLLPIDSSSMMRGENYTEYVETFVERVQPDVLSMDMYPSFELGDTDGCGSRAGYRAGLSVMRNAALRADIPFWNFFNTMPYNGHADPTEAQLAWQIFTSLTYGAKGILYFCYWSPVGQSHGDFIRGGGIIYPRGTLNATAGSLVWESATKLYRKGAHYRHAKRLNSIVRNWGRPQYLLNATSTAVYRVLPRGGVPIGKQGECGHQPTESLAGCPISSVTCVDVSGWSNSPKAGDGMLIGSFSLADGRTALMLHNQNMDSTLWPTVEFAAPYEWTTEGNHGILEVDPETGEEAPILDDSPAMLGLQMSFESGMARFLVLASRTAVGLKPDDLSLN